MNPSTKPQILPRNSLLKNRNDNASNVKIESNNGTITKLPKPALPAKPIISSKPTFTENKNEQSVDDKTNLNKQTSDLDNHKPVADKVDKKSVNNITKQASQNEVTRKNIKKPLAKFRLTSADLNRLRYRNEFVDNKNVDDKGRFLIYDVREDEEQINKMNEICELLVAGGYFRARIKGLHNFDKIIGGMCWAIQMCNFDLDIDIFYKESLSIGQKIALTEKIVGALQEMKCPFKLEPHQIQGMDCIHIYPAIQWLVKKSFETRQQNANYIRNYSTWQFNRIFNFNNDYSNSVIFNNDEFIDPIKAKLRRRFIHPSRNKLKDEASRIDTTLLEYGIIGSGSNQRILPDNFIDKIDESTDKDKTETLITETDESVKTLLNSMTKTDENRSTGKVSTSIVGRIVSEQSEKIKRLAKDYEQSKSTLSSKDVEYLREESRLKEEINRKQAEINKILKTNSNEKLSSIKEKIQMVDNKMEELKQTEREESEEERNEKLRLIEVLNVLRQQKSELKQHCREEKKRLETQIEMIEANQTNNDQMNDKLKEIGHELAQYEERYGNVKKQLALVTKKYATLQRKFDEIPNRTELGQYQKRFLELYNQLSNKHNETKKFFTLYNTLSDERMYLEKEFNLINSILENFQKASISSPMVKDEFLVKFQQTVDSIILNKNKIEQRLMNENKKRDQLNMEYGRLIEEQRLYFIAVKAFKNECKINEELIIELEKAKLK